MKQVLKLGWLVMAAALTITMGACSNDDNITTEPTTTTEPQAVSTVHVTVGAGIGDGDGTTRAAVTQEGTTRTLTFTAGDRLYVVEGIYSSNPVKYLAGYLDIVGTPADGATSATFSGDLGVYLNDGTPSTYDFGDADPLTVDVPGAMLVPADAPAGFVSGTIPHIVINASKMIAADVNTLMTSALYVSGVYDSSTNSFSLSGTKPILNCTIGNLKENTEYTVKLRYASNQSFYESNTLVSETTYDAMTVMSDNDGIARFAISGLTNITSYNRYYVLRFVPVAGGLTKDCILGQKDLGAKVYNVTKIADYNPNFSYNQSGSEADILTNFGLNESTWSQQSDYGLLKFRCSFVDTPGGAATMLLFYRLSIEVASSILYDIVDTSDDGAGNRKGFNNNFQFYVAMRPISDKPLKITYDPNNGQYTYVGTVANVTLAGGNVLDLGTVELVKTTN